MDLPSLSATQSLAQHVVKLLPKHALLLLVGELGAGKTTLSQSIVACLGSQAKVSSPTYTLIHEYPTEAGVVVHIDAYRLDSVDMLLQFGFEDYLERAHLVIVEWGEALLPLFPDAWLMVIDFDGESRSVTLDHQGRRVIA